MTNPYIDALKDVLSEPIVGYHPPVAKAVGGPLPAVFLEMVIHWSKFSRDGWVFRTQDQVEEATALTRKNQETARRSLKKVGVLIEARKGIPARLYYRVDWDVLASLLDGTSKNDRSGHTGMTDPDEQECPDGTDRNDRSGQSLNRDVIKDVSYYVIEEEEGPSTSSEDQVEPVEEGPDPALFDDDLKAVEANGWSVGEVLDILEQTPGFPTDRSETTSKIGELILDYPDVNPKDLAKKFRDYGKKYKKPFLALRNWFQNETKYLERDRQKAGGNGNGKKIEDYTPDELRESYRGL